VSRPAPGERPFGVVRFLMTAQSRSKADLQAALAVVRDFKECESRDEWFMVAFAHWAKLEQLEEFLAHLVDPLSNPLADDTVAEIGRYFGNPQEDP
jgi:hypothetical protein